MQAMKAANTYRSVGMTTTSGLKLIVQVYELTMDHMTAATNALERGDMAEKGDRIGKALNALMELRAVLDFENGGEVAQTLDRVYDYLVQLLVKANGERERKHLDEAITLWGTLLDAWRQADASQGS